MFRPLTSPSSSFPSPVHGYPLRPVGRWLVATTCLLLLAGFGLARSLEPDPRGYGTHQRLGLPPGMKFAEQLIEVQALMAKDDPRARRLYETIGVCFGHALALYQSFYDVAHVLILGRVTSGDGGEIIIAKAREALAFDFPGLEEKLTLSTPDETQKRHGQAVAAASLPPLRP